ncbi:MAG TPA: hypothetical protein VIX59_15955 [Candidatus Binataceae bacterium]
MIRFGLILILALAILLYPARAVRQLVRLAIACAVAGAITAYFWLPLLIQLPYVSRGATLAEENPASGLVAQIAPVFNGALMDFGRFPVLGLMVVFGVAYALYTRDRAARVGLGLLVLWLILYLLPQEWPGMRASMPMGKLAVTARFNAGLQGAAILLIGLGSEWLWKLFRPLRPPWRVVPALFILLLMIPALVQRYSYYRKNREAVERSARDFNADSDLRATIARISSSPPGRVYWQAGAFRGLGALNLRQISTFLGLPGLDPGQHFSSLNSPLLRHFNVRDPGNYQLFNVRYVVMAGGRRASRPPPFFQPLLKTDRYVLYGVKTSGYTEFVDLSPGTLNITPVFGAQKILLGENQWWVANGDAAAGKFMLWPYPPLRSPPTNITMGASDGISSDEEASAGRIAVWAECKKTSTLVFKVTYHPNWVVTIDGQRQQTFMVTPSYIGVQVPVGRHRVVAEYRSGLLKQSLLLAGLFSLIAAVVLRDRFSRLEETILGVAVRWWPAVSGAKQD